MVLGRGVEELAAEADLRIRLLPRVERGLHVRTVAQLQMAVEQCEDAAAAGCELRLGGHPGRGGDGVQRLGGHGLQGACRFGLVSQPLVERAVFGRQRLAHRRQQGIEGGVALPGPGQGRLPGPDGLVAQRHQPVVGTDHPQHQHRRHPQHGPGAGPDTGKPLQGQGQPAGVGGGLDRIDRLQHLCFKPA
ncbi:MAG: hypothetical protein ACOVOT_05795 [Rubrivivax sp.]